LLRLKEPYFHTARASLISPSNEDLADVAVTRLIRTDRIDFSDVKLLHPREKKYVEEPLTGSGRVPSDEEPES
jgi:hypothetical protein